MAVTVRNYTISPPWNSDDVLNAIETALGDIGYHTAAQTGTILTFTNSTGTTIAGAKGNRYLVKQSSTSGSGSAAVFDIVRNTTSGAIGTVTLVNGGVNYAASNTLTIAGTAIGGTSPTDDLTITASTVSGSQGTTTTWYDKESATPYTWGVCCVTNNATKKMGETFYSFFTPAAPAQNPVLYIRSGPGFQSNTNVFNGVSGLDYYSSNVPNSTTLGQIALTLATSNRVTLKLKLYQSGIDPNFVIWSFYEDSGVSGSIYRTPFFLSKFETAYQPWSLDDCFTGSAYLIGSTAINTYDAAVSTQTSIGFSGKRQGEWGYLGNQSATARFLIGYYESIIGKRITGANATNCSIYNRSIYDYMQNSVDYNPIITGLPICHIYVPCPYFIPADFGVMELTATNNLSYGDTVTNSGATWTVVQYSNNYTYNTGMAFLAKTADS